MKKQKIALIEDDKILSKVIYEELQEAGFIVDRAFDGKKGMKLVKSKKPDLVLLDLVLPKMHGFEVLEELKKFPGTSNIPVIILTMLGSDNDIKKGLKLGANDYIVKSQHAVAEIVENVKKFFENEPHSEVEQLKAEKLSDAKQETNEEKE